MVRRDYLGWRYDNFTYYNAGTRVVTLNPTYYTNFWNQCGLTTVPTLPRTIASGSGFPISPAGLQLRSTLDGMNVKEHWPADGTFSWRTGTAAATGVNGGVNSGAFVEAVCTRLGVPLLEPTAGNFAANRQRDWLLQDGAAKGWHRVGPLDAQLLANQGWVVIAAWKNPTPGAGYRNGAGLVAVVRPAVRPAAEVPATGPMVAVAAKQNFKFTPVKSCFPPQAWAEEQIVYVAHPPGKAP